jgi:hypothetical protein
MACRQALLVRKMVERVRQKSTGTMLMRPPSIPIISIHGGNASRSGQCLEEMAGRRSCRCSQSSNRLRRTDDRSEGSLDNARTTPDSCGLEIRMMRPGLLEHVFAEDAVVEMPPQSSSVVEAVTPIASANSTA